MVTSSFLLTQNVELQFGVRVTNSHSEEYDIPPSHNGLPNFDFKVGT